MNNDNKVNDNQEVNYDYRNSDKGTLNVNCIMCGFVIVICDLLSDV